MPLVESTQEVPLSMIEDGTIRIAGTRVSFESLVYHYQQGATAEEIVLRFPALRLADIHSCLAYYLNHQEKVEEYIVGRQRHADDLQKRISADPVQQRGLDQMRRRIKERKAAKQPSVS